MSLTDEDKQWIQERLDLAGSKIERVETTLLTEFHNGLPRSRCASERTLMAIRSTDAES